MEEDEDSDDPSTVLRVTLFSLELEPTSLRMGSDD